MCYGAGLRGWWGSKTIRLRPHRSEHAASRTRLLTRLAQNLSERAARAWRMRARGRGKRARVSKPRDSRADSPGGDLHRPWRDGSGVRVARQGVRGQGLADGPAQRRAALRAHVHTARDIDTLRITPPREPRTAKCKSAATQYWWHRIALIRRNIARDLFWGATYSPFPAREASASRRVPFTLLA